MLRLGTAAASQAGNSGTSVNMAKHYLVGGPVITLVAMSLGLSLAQSPQLRGARPPARDDHIACRVASARDRAYRCHTRSVPAARRPAVWP